MRTSYLLELELELEIEIDRSQLSLECSTHTYVFQRPRKVAPMHRHSSHKLLAHSPPQSIHRSP